MKIPTVLFFQNQLNNNLVVNEAQHILDDPIIENSHAVFPCSGSEDRALFFQNVFNTKAGINQFNVLFLAEVEEILVKCS